MARTASIQAEPATRPGDTRAALAVEYVPIDSLILDPANPRRIDECELDALTRSIQQFGFVDPVLVRREIRRVIGGHQRLLAARRLGLATVPVIFVDLDEDQARLLNLALNRIGGAWDEELLARLLADLGQHAAVDLSLSGFTEEETRGLLRRLDAREKRERPEQFDFDAAFDDAEKQSADTKPGDLWVLGEHRLLYGSATNPDDVARLLGGHKAAMAFTDPPYNVAYGDHGGQARDTRKRRLVNDTMPAAEWEAFCQKWAPNLGANVVGALYLCMSTKEWPTVSRILAEAGAHWSDTIIWNKGQFTLGRADYQRQYEPIWYGWPEGTKRQWHGGRDQGDVWQIPRPQESPLHPTMKPLALVERAIENSSQSGDPVLDLFLGSGTTLVACERTGRVCRGMEIDPRYVLTAVRRWEDFSGQKAVRA